MPKNSAAPSLDSLPGRANEGWLDRQTQDEESRRLYEQERLVAWIGEHLATSLEEAGMTRAELARKLGTSRAYVTRVLQGSSNLTLRSLSDLAWAAGSRVTIGFEPLRDGNFISCPVTVYSFPPVLVKNEEQTSSSEESPAWNNHALSA